MELVTRIDTPEKRESRIKRLMAAGLSREDATLVDDKVLETCDAMMSVLETKTDNAAAERPDLGLTIYHHVVRLMEIAMTDAHDEFHDMLDKEVSAATDLLERLAEVLSGDISPDRRKLH